MAEHFGQWIEQKRIEEGYSSIRELALRADVAATTLTDVINERTQPGFKLCKGLSRALRVPISDVLRQAGLLPPITEDVRLNEECLHNFNLLSVEHRRLVIVLLRALAKAYGPWTIDITAK